MKDKETEKGLAVVQPHQSAGMAIFDEAQLTRMLAVAEQFHKSGAVPQVFKNAGQVLMAIQAGVEVGMPPIEALQSFYVVNGTYKMFGRAVPGRLDRFGYYLEVVEKTATACILKIVEKSSGRSYQESYTMEDAAKAGLKGKDIWLKYPKDMLFYKCVSRVITGFCPHVLSGYKIVEDDDSFGEAELVDDSKPTTKQALATNAAAAAAALKSVAQPATAPTDATVISEESAPAQPDPSGSMAQMVDPGPAQPLDTTTPSGGSAAQIAELRSKTVSDLIKGIGIKSGKVFNEVLAAVAEATPFGKAELEAADEDTYQAIIERLTALNEIQDMLGKMVPNVEDWGIWILEQTKDVPGIDTILKLAKHPELIADAHAGIKLAFDAKVAKGKVNV